MWTATLGGAGHALEVCRRLSAAGRLIGIDQDEGRDRCGGGTSEGV